MNKINKVMLVSLLSIALLSISALGLSHNSHANTSNINFSAEIGASSTITIPDTTYSFSLTPSSNGSYGNVLVPVTVYSNSANGYLLTVSADSTSLIGTNDSNNTIATLDDNNNGNGYTLSNFTPNRWGIALNQTDAINTFSAFYPAPTSSNPLGIINAAMPTGSSGEQANISVGANINLETAADAYTTSLNFSVVAKVDTTLHCVEGVETCYMQDIDEWKDNINNSEALQVVDKRDNKVYWAIKDNSGNFWMTQNLDLDIDENTTYTSEDTDIPAGTTWTPMRSTYANDGYTWSGSNTTPESYDPGDKCWNGYMDYDRDSTIEDMPTCQDYTKHYSIGNYYNWTAAVAMNNSNNYITDEYNINQSICPAGWRLPNLNDTGFYQDLVNNGIVGIYSNPAYLIYGGNWGHSYYNSVASMGYYWYSTSKSGNEAYNLYFDVRDHIYLRNYDQRSYGLSVRCISR